MRDEVLLEKYIAWAYREGLRVGEAWICRFESNSKEALESMYKVLEECLQKDCLDSFCENVVRMYMQIKRPLSPVFLDAIYFRSLKKIAHAFLEGLREKLLGGVNHGH